MQLSLDSAITSLDFGQKVYNSSAEYSQKLWANRYVIALGATSLASLNIINNVANFGIRGFPVSFFAGGLFSALISNAQSKKEGASAGKGSELFSEASKVGIYASSALGFALAAVGGGFSICSLGYLALGGILHHGVEEIEKNEFISQNQKGILQSISATVTGSMVLSGPIQSVIYSTIGGLVATWLQEQYGDLQPIVKNES